jgi:hypothetical protein
VSSRRDGELTPRRQSPPCLAVLVRHEGTRSRLAVRRWLRNRYGIEQVQAMTLSREAWTALASGDASEFDAGLKDRLHLSLLGRPELIVVVGHDRCGDSRLTRAGRCRDVERVVQRIRAWDLPAEVIGIWLGMRRRTETSFPESREAGQADGTGTSARSGAGPQYLGVFRGDNPLWLAERVWEDDGGRVVSTPRPKAALRPRDGRGRNSHEVHDGRVYSAGARGARGAAGVVLGFRPGLALVASG